MGRFRPSDIVVLLNRSELSLESLFEQNTILLNFNNDSLCLYISGCPAMHLFELFIINIAEEDYFDIQEQLWKALYVNEWERFDVLIVSGQSKIRLYKLYEHPGFDSLDIIRHNVDAPKA